jgi:hypothetical protein
MLGDLQLGEFIYEQPALPDVEYTFKHSLTLEVAYNSVLSERRRTLHERTAAAIESLYGDRLDDIAAVETWRRRSSICVAPESKQLPEVQTTAPSHSLEPPWSSSRSCPTNTPIGFRKFACEF